MRAWIQGNVLYIHEEDAPTYRKTGGMVRNSYFWALKSIAARARRDRPWEFEAEIWPALQRMLLSFLESGYLSLTEVQLSFKTDQPIPENLRSVSTCLEESQDGEEAASDRKSQ
ncbi:hypothetical protein syc2142_c [Synechococcus elongatus PCC 6301]|uniref:Uncharacterized protein n=1 Tax=Synechococcus sp. (strain ATCC 27144 / PCC 6301 / SAUG 1402/1) TaxID=269084 RepID=A0A0H3K8C9_SYNP6|nr:hypothetical protein [Synechococcus elongatus]BAD80332.1 hypothetical protein syc2142_c [Synechococcus elongatus PCC 6301]